jgi:hypothetical protein
LGLQDEPESPATDEAKAQQASEEALNDQGWGGQCEANMTCDTSPEAAFVNSTSNAINRAQPGDLDPVPVEKTTPRERVSDAENWKRAAKNEVASEAANWVGVALLMFLGGEGAQDALDASDAVEERYSEELGESPNEGLIKVTVGAAMVFMPGPGGETKAGVEAFEVATHDALKARSVVGDALDLHHVGQAHAMEQLIPGYSRATAPSIVLPREQHALIPNLRGTVDLTPRQLLARDIMNLRNYTDAPNSSLRELIDLNKKMYPEAFAP